VRLEDGSEITLNTDTELSVALRDEARTVTMDHGEVFFSVAPDATRPFSAVCGEAAARCWHRLRRQLQHEGMSVSWSTGACASRHASAAATSRELGAGDAVRYDRQDNLAEISRVDPGKALAWQQRRLVFEDVPLAEVIRELQRYMEPPCASPIPRPARSAFPAYSVRGAATHPRGAGKDLGLAVTGPEQGPLLIARGTD